MRLDWQLRSMVGIQLFFEWKACATGLPTQAAVEDLRGESGNPKCRRHLNCHPGESCSKACHSSRVMCCQLTPVCAYSQDEAMVSAVLMSLPYLMVATAAEGKLQFHAILRKTPTGLVPVSGQTDLATPAGRAEAVIAIINLHRLLHGVKDCLPSFMLPLDYVVVRPS